MATIRFGVGQAIVTEQQKETISNFIAAGYKPAYDLLADTWEPYGLFYMRGPKGDAIYVDSEGKHHKR